MADDRTPLSGSDEPSQPAPSQTAPHETAPTRRNRRGVAWAVLAIGVGALIGTAILWPRGPVPDLGAQPNTFVDATVNSVEVGECPAVELDAPTECRFYRATVTSGPDASSEASAAAEFVVRDIDFGVPELSVGDEVVLLDVVTSPPPYRYTFSDMQRSGSLWLLVGLFVAAVVAFGRWQGLRALAGLAVSGLLVVAFIVPALLRDGPAVWIALSGTVLIAFGALYLAHGTSLATTVALAGTLVSLAAITIGALAMASLASLTGLADEEATVLRVTASALDLRGLLIAGIVIGALGVLDDVTVTQVSTVLALWRASPATSRRQIYREALAVGRDHVASTVNTLVLAYAGASLPVVLLFAQGAAPTGRLLTRELVAVELVRMLVGSIGLILSVPVTTGLAAWLLGPDDADRHHGHHHGPLDPANRPDADGADAGPRWEDFGPES